MMKKSLGSLMKSGASLLRPQLKHTHIQNNLKPSENMALQYLRKMLNSTYKDEVSMWGIPLTKTSETERSDIILLKFLRAKDFRVKDSYDMLCKSISWRKDFGTDSILKEDFGPVFNDRLFFSRAYMKGFDREGHPIWYYQSGVYNDKTFCNDYLVNAEEIQEFIRWRVQHLEKAIKMLDFKPGGSNSITQVVIYGTGFCSYYNPATKPFSHKIPDLDDVLDVIKIESKVNSTRILSILEDNYPGIVSYQILLDVPWYQNMLVSARARYFAHKHILKCVMGEQGNAFETLLKYIKAEHIPYFHGGMNDSILDIGSPRQKETVISEFTINGGEKMDVQIDGLVEGAKITWQAVGGGWDMEYHTKFVPDATPNLAIQVKKPSKMKSERIIWRDDYTVKEAGTFVIVFDNTTNKYTEVVAYRYIVQHCTLSRLREKKKIVRQSMLKAIKMLDFKPGGRNSITQVVSYCPGFCGYYNPATIPFSHKIPNWDEFLDVVRIESKVNSIRILSILEDNYPGMVSYQILLDIPWYQKLFVSARARYFAQKHILKFVMGEEGNVFETLFKYIKADHIPYFHGGMNNSILDFEFHKRLPRHKEPVISEFTINGGETFDVQIDGLVEGAKITWQAVGGGWDMEYHTKFVPDANPNLAIEVKKPSKMKSECLLLFDYYTVKEAGKFVIVFDNTTNNNREVVAYRYIVEHCTLSRLREKKKIVRQSMLKVK